jgi:hypothetical protein
MEFRLVYKGPLKGTKSTEGDPKHKHMLRRYFHKQLAELWNRHHALLALKERPLQGAGHVSILEQIADNFVMCGFRCVPLVSKSFSLVCGLDVLFLRPEEPGVMAGERGHGGDIDNRLKTLFDALTLPKNCTGITEPPRDDEKPFFCLLEDDGRVTSLNIVTDRLLTPLKQGRPTENEATMSQEGSLATEVAMHPELEVQLVIQVKIRPIRLGIGNIDFTA